MAQLSHPYMTTGKTIALNKWTFVGKIRQWSKYDGSVQFSHSVMSDSLQPHGLQHARLPCPAPTPRACSNSCPLSWCCHPTISSSVAPFSSCLQSFPSSGSFPMSQFFPSGGQGTIVSASASVLPMNIQDWLISSRIDWWSYCQSRRELERSPVTKSGINWTKNYTIVMDYNP